MLRAFFRLALAFAFAGPVAAQYPERPITMIVPWAAGGGTDVIARTVASLMEKELKQPINVVNRTGGGGVLGHQAIASAPADGYTIGMGTFEITAYKTMGIADITPKSFTPIVRIAEFPSSIQVRADSPYKTAQDALDAIRKQPGKFTASGTGQGGSWHIAQAGWLISEGVDPNAIRWVPSQGGAPALNEIVAGSIDFGTMAAGEAKGLIDAGKVRPLAVMSKQRLAGFPDVPTLKEATGSNWTMGTWFALVGPPGLPEPIVDRLVAAAKKATESPEFTKLVADRGYVPLWQPKAQFGQFMASSETEVARVLRQTGLAK
jgi:tripartite-type tricarboxylate transporter receptor subunit TctC